MYDYTVWSTVLDLDLLYPVGILDSVRRVLCVQKLWSGVEQRGLRFHQYSGSFAYSLQLDKSEHYHVDHCTFTHFSGHSF